MIFRLSIFASALVAANSQAVAPPGGCLVCGDGQVVGNPNAIFVFPSQPTTPCGILQDAGLNGVIPLDQCPFLPGFVAVCECAPGDLPGDPVAPPAAAPVVSPVGAPIPAPTAQPNPSPTAAPVPSPTAAPVPSPTAAPVPSPTAAPVPSPTAAPVPPPAAAPVPRPNPQPNPRPSVAPVISTLVPTASEVVPPIRGMNGMGGMGMGGDDDDSSEGSGDGDDDDDGKGGEKNGKLRAQGTVRGL